MSLGRRTVAAHRVAYQLTHKTQLKQGQCILHSCDMGHEGCVNPAHLRIGTKAENNKEARERGRHVPGRSFGEANGRAKINDDEKQAIIDMWNRRMEFSPRLTQAKIAEKFGIGRSRVGEIIRKAHQDK
jgi:hypothetical protein